MGTTWYVAFNKSSCWWEGGVVHAVPLEIWLPAIEIVGAWPPANSCDVLRYHPRCDRPATPCDPTIRIDHNIPPLEEFVAAERAHGDYISPVVPLLLWSAACPALYVGGS